MRISLHEPQQIYEIGKRTNQEDYVIPLDPTADDRLFILCDGMGGHERGEVASQRLAEGITIWFEKHFSNGMPLTDAMFRQAYEYGCRHLDKADRGDDDGRRMGTTLTFLCFHKGGCLVAHVGDSRIYHIRPSERRMLYKSKDHSLVCELYEAGEISFSEMSTSSQRNVITRAVTPGLDNRVEADVAHITDIKAGDYFYLCSDGMLEKMADDELIDIFSSRLSDSEKREQLERATVGNKDNHSAIILHVAQVVGEEGDEQFVDDEASSPYNALLMRREDADDEGTITIVDENADDDEHTAYASAQKPLSRQQQSPPKEMIQDQKGKTPAKSWLTTLVVAVVTAALVAAAYYLMIS